MNTVDIKEKEEGIQSDFAAESPVSSMIDLTHDLRSSLSTSYVQPISEGATSKKPQAVIIHLQAKQADDVSERKFNYDNCMPEQITFFTKSVSKNGTELVLNTEITIESVIAFLINNRFVISLIYSCRATSENDLRTLLEFLQDDTTLTNLSLINEMAANFPTEALSETLKNRTLTSLSLTSDNRNESFLKGRSCSWTTIRMRLPA